MTFVEECGEAGNSGTLMSIVTEVAAFDPYVIGIYLGTRGRGFDMRVRGRILVLPDLSTLKESYPVNHDAIPEEFSVCTSHSDSEEKIQFLGDRMFQSSSTRGFCGFFINTPV